MQAEIGIESQDERRPVSHRRAPEPGARRSRAARPSPGASPPTGGHRKPRPPRSPAPSSGTPSIVAGAAVLAVAAVGALNGGGEPAQQDATRQNVAQALPAEPAAPVVAAQAGAVTRAATQSPPSAAPSTTPAPVGPVLDAQDVALQRAVKASRDRARVALAARTKAAVELAKKEAAAAKAAAAATARAARMAALAKSYSLPVKGYHLTARFGQSGGRWSHNHTGLDFACRTGTEIHAVASGTVISAGWDGPYGWKTVIRHADGTETWYAHQSSFVVRSGHVDAGDVIGHVGSTGNTTGPHLHLEVVINGSPVDPDRWLSAHGLNP